MTQPTANRPQELDLSGLNMIEKGALHAAIRFYARDLRAEAEKARKKVAKDEVAALWEGEAAALEEEVVEASPGAMILYQHHLVALRKGLDILANVANSSKGINTSIDEPESVERSEKKAKLVKDRLIPMFAEQPELGLVGDADEDEAL